MLPPLHWTGEPFPIPPEGLRLRVERLRWMGESFPNPDLPFGRLCEWLRWTGERFPNPTEWLGQTVEWLGPMLECLEEEGEPLRNPALFLHPRSRGVQLFVVVGTDQDFAGLAALRGAEETVALHHVDQPGGAGEADPHAALEEA